MLPCCQEQTWKSKTETKPESRQLLSWKWHSRRLVAEFASWRSKILWWKFLSVYKVKSFPMKEYYRQGFKHVFKCLHSKLSRRYLSSIWRDGMEKLLLVSAWKNCLSLILFVGVIFVLFFFFPWWLQVHLGVCVTGLSH